MVNRVTDTVYQGLKWLSPLTTKQKIQLQYLVNRICHYVKKTGLFLLYATAFFIHSTWFTSGFIVGYTGGTFIRTRIGDRIKLLNNARWYEGLTGFVIAFFAVAVIGPTAILLTGIYAGADYFYTLDERRVSMVSDGISGKL